MEAGGEMKKTWGDFWGVVGLGLFVFWIGVCLWVGIFLTKLFGI
jgi:hypothetical protein